METNESQFIIDRAETALKSLQSHNSGADIHIVANIRHTATMLISMLESGFEAIPHKDALTLIESIETRLVDFFTKKYENWKN